ncbi:MAG: glycosyltransferase, partial [Verrucomicrobiia bacterium]
MPQLFRALEPISRPELLSTWSWRKKGPGVSPATNAWWLHEALWLYKRFPWLQRHNKTYDSLCAAFDRWLTSQLRPEVDVLYFLSGCGLESLRRMRAWGKSVVVDAGSTHTDWQHRVVEAEFRRNGLRYPLFPESYRSRVRTEFIEADFLQIPSTFVKQTFLAAGITEEKILMAPYGVDVDQFTPRKEEDIQPMFRVLCASGVNLRKGARILVEAWRKLGWRDTELHWIGWPEGPEVRHLFSEPLRGVVWHSWKSHGALSALYRSCDVKVLPSFEEGFARVLV